MKDLSSDSKEVKGSTEMSRQKHAIRFVDKEHFGPLIGKGGKNKLKIREAVQHQTQI